MANYATLKAVVQAVVKTNGNAEITGANMQSTLLSIINSVGAGYQFMGVATTSTSPGTPDYNVFYIAPAGTYSNFGTLYTVPVGSVGLFIYNGSWTTTSVALYSGIDNAPTGGSENIAKSGGIAATINSYQKPYETITEQEMLSNMVYIDNAYINSDGEIISISSTSSYHYVSLYKLPVSDFQCIVLKDAVINGDAKLLLYDSNGAVQSVVNTNVSPYVIDNSNGQYAYISFGTNIISKQVKIVVTPFAVDSKSNHPCGRMTPVYIPSALIDNRLLESNVYGSTVSGYYSVYGLYIGDNDKLVFIPYAGSSTTYRKLWLTNASGVVTEVAYPNSNYVIDNSDGNYKYISFNCRNDYTQLYSMKADAASEFVTLNNRASVLDDMVHTENIGTFNVLAESDIIEDTSINSYGYPANITPTASYKYSSVFFYPVKQFTRFTVSGNTSTSSYIKTYDDGFNETGSYTGQTNKTFYNSDGSIAYVSFTTKVNTDTIYLNVDGNIPVKKAIDVDREISYTVPLDWTMDYYVDSTDNLVSIPEGESYRYGAVRNLYVKNAKRISWSLFYGGSARVVLSDIDGNIIDTYDGGNHNKTINNSDGSIAYISLSNNFVSNASPVLTLTGTPTIGTAVEKLIDNINTSSPLYGKNLAVLGDSIMMLMADGNISSNTVSYVGTDGVTYALSDLTNIGGLLYVTSTLAGGQVVETTIQADVHNSNQENMDVETWEALRDMTNAAYIINTGRGGATITGNVITTAYPAPSQVTFNTIPNHCLELKRRVDAGEPSPDIIMLWAGTNDVRKFVVNGNWVEPTNFDEVMALDYSTQLLADTNEAMQNKQTFYGALRFCLEYLYRNFPNALVLLFSPIPSVVSPRTFERERKVGSYIKNMAERYSALFVDACVEMGITDIFDTETSHKWLMDGLHPNAAGKKLYCNYTAGKLSTVVFDKK